MRTTTTPDLAVRLRLAITRTARRLRMQAGGIELSPTLTAALATVANHGPLTPLSELARREGVQRPTATKLVERARPAEGYVVRTEERSSTGGRS